MGKAEKIPTFDTDAGMLFFSNTIDWQPILSNIKHRFFHINRLETLVNDLNFPLRAHRKTIFDFLYLKKGTSKRSKGLTMYDIGESSMFFLPSYQITRHETMSNDVEGFFCYFDDKIFEVLPKNYLPNNFSFFQFQANPVVNLSPSTQRIVEGILERLIVIYEDENGTDKFLIAAYLLVLFEEVKKEMPQQIRKAKSAFWQITEQYKDALVKYIYEKHTVSEFANHLNITPNYLNKCIKSSINKTAQDLLNEMLILEAKTLLKYSDLQIAEIAVKLGNQNPSNFSRLFKAQTGVSPREYISSDTTQQ